jgi:hypothetical protein
VRFVRSKSSTDLVQRLRWGHTLKDVVKSAAVRAASSHVRLALRSRSGILTGTLVASLAGWSVVCVVGVQHTGGPSKTVVPAVPLLQTPLASTASSVTAEPAHPSQVATGRTSSSRHVSTVRSRSAPKLRPSGARARVTTEQESRRQGADGGASFRPMHINGDAAQHAYASGLAALDALAPPAGASSAMPAASRAMS